MLLCMCTEHMCLTVCMCACLCVYVYMYMCVHVCMQGVARNFRKRGQVITKNDLCMKHTMKICELEAMPVYSKCEL